MMHLLRSLVVIVMVTFGTSALALAPCGDVVVDTAGVLRDISGVQTAAANLAKATGAEVRVRIAPDYAPSSNLDQHVERVADTVCQSWNNQAGNRRSNLVILYVTTNRQIGLYFGDQWEPELKRSWPSILERMKPALRDGDYDRAMILGLKRVEETILKADAPAPNTFVPKTPPVTERVVERVVEREPVDLKPFAMVLLGAILLLGFIFGLNRVYAVYANHRRAEGLRLTAQQKAVEAFNAVGALSLKAHDAHNKAVAAIAAAASSTTTAQLQEWQAKVEAFFRKLEDLRVQFNSPADPSREGLTHEEYEASQGVFEQLRADYQSVASELAEFADEVTRVIAIAESLPAEYETVRALVPDVGAKLHKIEQQGFVMTIPEAEFRAGQELIDSARRAMDNKEWKEAEAALTEARKQLTQTVKTAEGLPARRKKAQKDLESLRVQVGSFATLIEHARGAMTDMVSAFTADCYRIVAGNGTEAERLHVTLTGKISALEKLLEKQDWDAVQTELVAAAEAWEDIEDLLEAIVHRKEHLDQMVKDAKDEYKEAKESISAAEAYLTQHPSFATAEHKQVLKDSKQSLSEASKLMKKEPLPIVELFRQLSSVDDVADTVLAGTQDAVKEEAARVERAARLVRDIEGRIGDHRRYFKNHRGDLSQALTKALDEIEADFNTLKRERSVAQTITLGAQLEAALDQVDRAAKQAVRKAEAEREEKRRAEEAARRRREEDEADERRRRSSSYTSSGFGSSSRDDSSSSGFGGGSSSFGSGSSGFGGGSSSW